MNHADGVFASGGGLLQEDPCVQQSTRRQRQKSIYAVKCIAGKTKENKRNTATEILQYINVLYNIHELINNINVLKM